MKKVININFQGRVIPIEETAYDILTRYIESLRRFFANEEGKDEIINDIEGRIAELFGETLKKDKTCITDDDVNAVISSMGRPEDFDAEEINVQSQLSGNQKSQGSQEQQQENYQYQQASTGGRRLYRDENDKVLGGVCAGVANYFGIDKIVIRILAVLGFGIAFLPYLILWVAVPSSATKVIGSTRKRLFRDSDSKIIGGVCSGLAQYFGVNVWIPRLLFLIPFLSLFNSWNHWGWFDFPNFLNFSFSPGATIVYIILWLVLPEAKTTSEKLEMKGEKVDRNSIKSTIQGDMEGFKERAQDFGKEVGEKAKEIGKNISESGKAMGTSAGTVAKRTGSTLGDIIMLIFKIFAYFILAVVLFALVVSLFAIGITVTSMLPAKAYLITSGWQDILTWGTILLFIWVPVIGIITWIIRRIAKTKSNSNPMRYTFAALWIVGLFCFIGLLASLRNDFEYHSSPEEQNIVMQNPGVDFLQLRFAKSNKYYFHNNWLHLEPYIDLDQDTAFVQNIHVRILKSEDANYHATMLKLSNGGSREDANKKANNIKFNVNQVNDILYFDRGIPITTEDKFRNQSVYVTIYVPVGKRIKVEERLGWGNDFKMHFGDNVDEWRWRNDEGYNWEDDVEYIMANDGLKRMYPEKNNDDENDNNTDEDIINNNQQNNTTPADTTRYKYNAPAEKPAVPEQKTDTIKKTAGQVSAQSEEAIKNVSESIGNIGSILLQRFAL